MRCCLHEVKPSVRRSLRKSSLKKDILQGVERAVGDFGMLHDGDRVLVAVSGGKDSYTLLHMLEKLRRRAEVSFSLVAVNIHHGFEGYRSDRIAEHLESGGFEHVMHRRDIARLIETKLRPNDTACALCARMRRGVLYELAPKLGCNKIALGHHKDDLIETLLLNLFFTGEIKSMPPVLVSDDRRNVVIRPLAYVDEPDIAAYAIQQEYPIVCCSCPACGVRDNMQRRALKEMLEELEVDHPSLKSNILTSMRNVVPTHLMDKSIK